MSETDFLKAKADPEKSEVGIDDAKDERDESKAGAENVTSQLAIGARALEIKDRVFSDIEKKHKSGFYIHAYMPVTPLDLKNVYNYREDEQVLKRVLEILCEEGRLTYDTSRNAYVHR